jgi:hypothetical protein
MLSSADRMGPTHRATATFAVIFALAPSLGRADAQAIEEELPPADQARGLVDPHPVQPVDAALLFPRVVLGFPRIVFDLVHLPILGTLRFLDRHHVISGPEDARADEPRTGAILPVVTVDSFFGAGVGVAAYHEDVLGHQEHASVSARFGGRDRQAYQLAFSAGHTTTISSLVGFEQSPELLFQGIGADGPEARFGQDRFLAILRGGQSIGPIEVSAAALYNHREIEGGTVAERYDTATIPGFDEGIETLELRGGAGFDGKRLRGEVFIGGVPHGARYWHWGAELTGVLDLWAPERRLVLRAGVEGVNGDEVPFTDLPSLGGPQRLRGYPLDRFRGNTALLGTMEYRYPVHQWVTGALYVDAGKVTGNRWRAGGGLGVIAHSGDRLYFTLDIAYGQGVQVVLSTDPLRMFSNKDTER